jgi:hypothetical protein
LTRRCATSTAKTGRDAIVAANLSANALAELAAAEKTPPDPTCAGMADPPTWLAQLPRKR